MGSELASRRIRVLRRLLDRGVRERTLAVLLPGWELLIADAARLRDSADRNGAA